VQVKAAKRKEKMEDSKVESKVAEEATVQLTDASGKTVESEAAEEATVQLTDASGKTFQRRDRPPWGVFKEQKKTKTPPNKSKNPNFLPPPP
jgi:hypothetical protein